MYPVRRRSVRNATALERLYRAIEELHAKAAIAAAASGKSLNGWLVDAIRREAEAAEAAEAG